MNWFKGLNELGKTVLNIGTAIIIFAIIQPLVKKEFSWEFSIASFIVSSILFAVGTFLSSLGGNKDES